MISCAMKKFFTYNKNDKIFRDKHLEYVENFLRSLTSNICKIIGLKVRRK